MVNERDDLPDLEQALATAAKLDPSGLFLQADESDEERARRRDEFITEAIRGLRSHADESKRRLTAVEFRLAALEKRPSRDRFGFVRRLFCK